MQTSASRSTARKRCTLAGRRGHEALQTSNRPVWTSSAQKTGEWIQPTRNFTHPILRENPQSIAADMFADGLGQSDGGEKERDGSVRGVYLAAKRPGVAGANCAVQRPRTRSIRSSIGRGLVRAVQESPQTTGVIQKLSEPLKACAAPVRIEDFGDGIAPTTA